MPEEPKKWFVVRMVDDDGTDHHTILQSPDELTAYMELNAADASTFQISAVEPENLAEAHIISEFFSEEG